MIVDPVFELPILVNRKKSTRASTFVNVAVEREEILYLFMGERVREANIILTNQSTRISSF